LIGGSKVAQASSLFKTWICLNSPQFGLSTVGFSPIQPDIWIPLLAIGDHGHAWTQRDSGRLERQTGCGLLAFFCPEPKAQSPAPAAFGGYVKEHPGWPESIRRPRFRFPAFPLSAFRFSPQTFLYYTISPTCQPRIFCHVMRLLACRNSRNVRSVPAVAPTPASS
jgi:hypothetical protein